MTRAAETFATKLDFIVQPPQEAVRKSSGSISGPHIVKDSRQDVASMAIAMEFIPFCRTADL
jgi:hypothetical protein